MGYYSMLADGMLAGRLSIDYTPDEVNLIDMVPFEGRYYLQWGPVPAVFHLVVKLAGWELSDRVACLLAGWLASLAFLGILLKLRQVYFRGAPLWVGRWLFLAFALGTPTAFVALRTTIYHESIGVAAMFIVFGCLALLRYIDTRSARWVWLCGAALALAIGTRVTHVCYAAGFFLGLVALEFHWRPGWRISLPRLTGFALPVFAACVMHLAYNQARFGSPWEYGLQYMADPIQQEAGFSIRRIPENFLHYVVAPIGFKAGLPWIEHAGWKPLVWTSRAEGMSSLLLASPFLLFGLYVSFRRERCSEYGRELWLFVVTVGGSATLSFLLLASYTYAGRRYMQDFVPAMMVVAAAGVGLWAQGGRNWKIWRWPAVAALAFSFVIHLHLAFTQPFFTPPPDPNAMKTFVAWSPVFRGFLEWPESEDEARIRNDLGVRYLQQRRHAEALEHFKVADELMPDSEVIQKNLVLTRLLMTGRSR